MKTSTCRTPGGGSVPRSPRRVTRRDVAASWACAAWRSGGPQPQDRAGHECLRDGPDSRPLIDDLRKPNVKEVNEGLLGVIELRPFDAGVSLARSPGSPATPLNRDAASPK